MTFRPPPSQVLLAPLPAIIALCESPFHPSYHTRFFVPVLVDRGLAIASLRSRDKSSAITHQITESVRQ
jgi:hypothetical protein